MVTTTIKIGVVGYSVDLSKALTLRTGFYADKGKNKSGNI